MHTCGALRAISAKSDIHDIDRTHKMGFILTANQKRWNEKKLTNIYHQTHAKQNSAEWFWWAHNLGIPHSDKQHFRTWSDNQKGKKQGWTFIAMTTSFF